MTDEEAVPNPDPPVRTSIGCCRRQPYGPCCQFKLVWWTLLALAFLIVGLVSPGWLRLNVRLHLNTEFSYRDLIYSSTYQDYSLWSVTQCLCRSYGYNCDCETRSYNFINGKNEESRLAILGIRRFDDAGVYYRGVPLVFSFGTMWALQACYVIGVVFATLNVYFAYELRMKSTIKFCTVKNLQNAIVLSFIPGALAFVPCIVMGAKSLSIQGLIRYEYDSGTSSYGLVFGAIGSCIMMVYGIPMLIHTRICRCDLTDATYYANNPQGGVSEDSEDGQQNDATVELVKVTNTTEEDKNELVMSN